MMLWRWVIEVVASCCDSSMHIKIGRPACLAAISSSGFLSNMLMYEMFESPMLCRMFSLAAWVSRFRRIATQPIKRLGCKSVRTLQESKAIGVLPDPVGLSIMTLLAALVFSPAPLTYSPMNMSVTFWTILSW